MVHRQISIVPDDASPVPSATRFVLATGSLMALFAVASVWVGGLLGG